MIAMIVVALLPYLIQLIVVTSWRIFPVAQEELGGYRYSLKRGKGNSDDFLPLLGVLNVFDPAYLVIESIGTGDKTIEEYDFVSQAIVMNKEVFSEDYRQLRLEDHE